MVWVLNHGIQLFGMVVSSSPSLDPPHNVSHFPAPLSLLTDLGFRPNYSNDRQNSVIDDDWRFFTNIFGRPLKEEMYKIEGFAKRAFVALTLCGSMN